MPRLAMPRHRSTFRRAFTMVEMLIVISIIGMLAALLSVGIRSALRRAREARAGTELSQLHNAMNDFKGKYGAFPPSLGTPLENAPAAGATYTSETQAQRQSRVLRFLARAFPQYNPQPSGIYTIYGVVQQTIAGATVYAPNFTLKPYRFDDPMPQNVPNLLIPASRNCCDIETLDPAEAIVFWLGGMARRRTNSSGRLVYELTGFSSDPGAPFRMSVTRQEWSSGNAEWQQQGYIDNQRTPPLFKFDSARLKDVDNDGWPEYYPDLPDTGDGVAPYVYFSSADYALHPAYPYFDATGDANADVDDYSLTFGVDERALMARWGLAKPFASLVNTPAASPANQNYNNWQITWVQPDSFQIISAGSDGKYGGRPTYTGDTSVPSASQLEGVLFTRLFPDAKVVSAAGTTVKRVDMVLGELDNLTNFTTGRLEGDLTPNK